MEANILCLPFYKARNQYVVITLATVLKLVPCEARIWTLSSCDFLTHSLTHDAPLPLRKWANLEYTNGK